MVAQLPQRLKSTLFEITCSLYRLFGAAVLKKTFPKKLILDFFLDCIPIVPWLNCLLLGIVLQCTDVYEKGLLLRLLLCIYTYAIRCLKNCGFIALWALHKLNITWVFQEAVAEIMFDRGNKRVYSGAHSSPNTCKTKIQSTLKWNLNVLFCVYNNNSKVFCVPILGEN